MVNNKSLDNGGLKLNKVCPSLISSDETVYIKNRFIRKAGRLISNISDICDSKKLSGLEEKQFLNSFYTKVTAEITQFWPFYLFCLWNLVSFN